MIYTVSAIICVAIAGTVMSVSTRQMSVDNSGYDCTKEYFANYSHITFPKIGQCLGREKWSVADPINGNLTLADDCCYFVEMITISMAQFDSNCRKVTDYLDKTIDKITIGCRKEGHDVSDRFCAAQLRGRHMSADCQRFINGLTSGVHSHRLSTPVLVLLAAIVVSIAGDVYDFH